MRNKIFNFIVLIVFISAIVAIYKCSMPVKKDLGDILKDFNCTSETLAKSLEGKESCKIYEGIIKCRDDLIKSLVGVIKKENAVDGKDLLDAKVAAIMLLGEMRASEAVGILCDNIELTPSIRTSEFSFPAANALIKIGKPASKEIIRRLSLKKYEEQAWLFLWALENIKGADVSVVMLDKELKRCDSEDIDTRAMLESAIKHFREKD